MAAGALAAVIGWWLAVVRGCEERGRGRAAAVRGRGSVGGGWRRVVLAAITRLVLCKLAVVRGDDAGKGGRQRYAGGGWWVAFGGGWVAGGRRFVVGGDE